MKCDGCKHAEWQRTKNGRLHPSGDGRCVYLRDHPLDLRIPSSFYWGCWTMTPKPDGGYIERGVELDKYCEFYDAGSDDEPR